MTADGKSAYAACDQERKDFCLETCDTDILIIGGGTAGCLAAVEARMVAPELEVLILEKANIERSGCLAAGMNAINAYLHPGETPESFLRYVRYDAMGLCREDLVLSQAGELNAAVDRVTDWGLPILRDENGRPARRGRWNLKINGERLKPLIARQARRAGARVLNRVVATDFLLEGGRVVGAIGFGVRDAEIYRIRAKATIVATGGAAGIYKPNTDGSAHHRMWYSPFNTGAGYAMGIRAGAELTSLEMRFIALRTKDSVAPTGTLALGFGASQINARGERFMATRFGHLGGDGAPTCLRVYGPVQEIKEGRGPCYMDTRGLPAEKVRELKAAYLDMYPNLVLQWAANGHDPGRDAVEIMGTEPYLVGGHAQAGYWVETDRSTTLEGLWAAGDVAGGAPYKFVSGCFAEGMIAARAAARYAAAVPWGAADGDLLHERILRPLWTPVGNCNIQPQEMEERLQRTMDQYAGGIGSFYEMNEERLLVALGEVQRLQEDASDLSAADPHELLQAHEIMDRVQVAETLLHHLLHRKETRWPGFQTRLDYPERLDEHWLKFVNTRRDRDTGRIEVLERPYHQMVDGDRYQPR